MRFIFSPLVWRMAREGVEQLRWDACSPPLVLLLPSRVSTEYGEPGFLFPGTLTPPIWCVHHSAFILNATALTKRPETKNTQHLLSTSYTQMLSGGLLHQHFKPFSGLQKFLVKASIVFLPPSLLAAPTTCPPPTHNTELCVRKRMNSEKWRNGQNECPLLLGRSP